VLGPSADELHFAKEVRSLGRLAERNWLVQPRGVSGDRRRRG
jgi:hypothetical protein